MTTSTSIQYGVDWSASASPTSHCWFPLTSKESTLVRCGSCALEIDLRNINDSIQPCRPSFVDTKEKPLANDEHSWWRTSLLSTSCEHCQRTSTNNSNSLFMNPFTSFDKLTTMINPKTSHGPCDGIVCLWCGKNYHQSCWQQLTDDEKKTKCDYGIFQ